MSGAEARPRGAHVLDAALTVIAEQGFVGLSMRAVAAEAGTSLAQVQYYFHSKNQLVGAAFGYVGNRFLAALRELPAQPPSVARLRAAVWLWLPLDADRDRAARVWLAFAAAAVNDHDLAVESRRLDAELRAWFASELQTLQVAGAISGSCDTRTVAAQLLALIDGITVESLVVPVEQRYQLASTAIDPLLQSLTKQGA